MTSEGNPASSARLHSADASTSLWPPTIICPEREIDLEMTPEDRITELRNTYLYFSTNGPDVFRKAFARRAIEWLDESGSLHSLLGEWMKDNPAVSPVVAGNTLEKVVQGYLMRVDPDYPAGGYAQPSAWDKGFSGIMAEDEIERTKANLRRNRHSNKSGRSKPLKATAVAHGKFKNISVLEIGTSQKQILKQLAMHLNPGFRYGLTKIAYHDTTQSPDIRRNNFLLSHAMNHLIQRGPFAIDIAVGVDCEDPDNEEVQEQARSDSFYAGELLRLGDTLEYDKISVVEPPNVKHVVADFSDFDHDYFRWQLDQLEAPDQFDLVAVPTTLNQLPSAIGEKVLANCLPYVKSDGILVAQDFADLRPDGSIKFEDMWYDHTYRAHVLDMTNFHAGLQHELTMDSGRAREIILEPAFMRLPVVQKMGFAALVA